MDEQLAIDDPLAQARAVAEIEVVRQDVQGVGHAILVLRLQVREAIAQDDPIEALAGPRDLVLARARDHLRVVAPAPDLLAAGVEHGERVQVDEAVVDRRHHDVGPGVRQAGDRRIAARRVDHDVVAGFGEPHEVVLQPPGDPGGMGGFELGRQRQVQLPHPIEVAPVLDIAAERGLRHVQVDAADLVAVIEQRDDQVHGRGRLAGAALLAADDDDPPARLPAVAAAGLLVRLARRPVARRAARTFPVRPFLAHGGGDVGDQLRDLLAGLRRGRMTRRALGPMIRRAIGRAIRLAIPCRAQGDGLAGERADDNVDPLAGAAERQQDAPVEHLVARLVDELVGDHARLFLGHHLMAMLDRPGQAALGHELAHRRIGDVAAAIADQALSDEAELGVVRVAGDVEVEGVGRDLADVGEIEVADQGDGFVRIRAQSLPVMQEAGGHALVFERRRIGVEIGPVGEVLHVGAAPNVA